MKERLEKLTKKELIDLLVEYNNYILDFEEDFNGILLDRTPVCVMEFYDNEYQEVGEIK